MSSSPRHLVAEAGSITESLALAAFLCFVFWDFYLPSQGIRPLDVIGAILLAVGLFAPYARRHLSSSVDILLPLMAILVTSAAVAGAIADSTNIRAAIGICAGLMVFVLFAFWPLTASGILRAANAALAINLFGFWAQFAVYYASGAVLNFYGFLGAEPRVFGAMFRAAGLYLEPAHFALMSFLLLVLKIYFSERLDLMCWVAIVSVIASLSLWGVISVAVLLVAWNARRTRGLLIVCLALLGLGIALVMTNSWQEIIVIDRLAHFATDPSASARYGGLEHFSKDQLWQFSFWLGRGVSVDYLGMGANSLSYLLTSVGVTGTVLICGGLVMRSRPGMRFYVFAAVSLTLSAAYLWTYMFWWSWMALIGRTDLHPEPRS